MLFQNAKEINLKVLVSPILNLWNKFQIYLASEFIVKKAKPSDVSVFQFWSS